MSQSGVTANDEAIKAFNSFKLGGNKKDKNNYIIYRLSDDKSQIIVDEEGRVEKYDEFVEKLPENDGRYAVFDFEYELPDGAGHRSKIVFYTWSPDSAPIKSKMIYASSKDALRRSLNGVAADIQGTDFDEVDYKTVHTKLTTGR